MSMRSAGSAAVLARRRSPLEPRCDHTCGAGSDCRDPMRSLACPLALAALLPPLLLARAGDAAGGASSASLMSAATVDSSASGPRRALQAVAEEDLCAGVVVGYSKQVGSWAAGAASGTTSGTLWTGTGRSTTLWECSSQCSSMRQLWASGGTTSGHDCAGFNYAERSATGGAGVCKLLDPARMSGSLIPQEAGCPYAVGVACYCLYNAAAAVDCVGAWGAWGACTPSCDRGRFYTVTTAALNGGAACEDVDGADAGSACNDGACSASVSPPPAPPAEVPPSPFETCESMPPPALELQCLAYNSTDPAVRDAGLVDASPEHHTVELHGHAHVER